MSSPAAKEPRCLCQKRSCKYSECHGYPENSEGAKKCNSIISEQSTLNDVTSLESEDSPTTSLHTPATSLKTSSKTSKKLPKANETIASIISQGGKRNPTLLMTISHAEAVDAVFPDWLEKAFPKKSGDPFRVFDLNMPINLPWRPRREYAVDPPITEHGKQVAAIIAVDLASQGLESPIVYAAPEMKCLETAREMVEKWKCNALIRVEPALADCRGLAKRATGTEWLSTERLVSLRYPVDQQYRPIMPSSNLPPIEEPVDYYNRLLSVFSIIAKDDSQKNVLVVAHPTTVFFTENGTWSTHKHVERMDRLIKTCELSCIKIDEGNMATNCEVIKPFTRNLSEAREHRNKSMI
ncbi:hypothetical protein QR680_018575 [Steinernema hermaphroditum]|uniref:Uncharacterized protein n=1 Tax=Steinernema hermaphroditum TaxID=289476 RepID=A0AA39LR85_9BILA|nr:hypothetical protein QR680_018575 [Steinernema hermaphroditum]